MRVTVIKNSVIYKGEIYGIGGSFDADELIGKSLIERGYVKETDGAEVIEGTLDEAQLQEMSVKDLKRLAGDMGLDTSGKKDELIARICNEKVNVEVEEDEIVDEGGNEAADDLPDTSMPE